MNDDGDCDSDDNDVKVKIITTRMMMIDIMLIIKALIQLILANKMLTMVTMIYDK